MDVAVFGIIVADVIGAGIDVSHPPVVGSLRHVESITMSSGGNVCNVGTALARLGFSVTGCGVVGNDLLGQSIIEQLNGSGVRTSGIHTTDRARTSATIVALDATGERTFFHARGVNELLDARRFRACTKIFARCRWLHIGYFGLLPELTPDLPKLLRKLKQTAPDIKIALDTLNPLADWDLLKPILPHLDLFAPSRPEAVALSGETRPEKMVKFFRAEMPRGMIAIKLDEEGCHVDRVTEVVDAPAYRVKVVDSTGAGDAWFAGMLAGLLRKMPLPRCALLANRVAADCCTAVGASSGIRPLKRTLSRL